MERASSPRALGAVLLLSGPLSLGFAPSSLAAQPLPARTIENEGASSIMPGLEAFVDGLVASHMAERVAGTQVAVVKDGRVLLVKGYGIASLAPERPVDPERTLFRIASISKTFTWLALMQLADAGKLRLEHDVNMYLPRELALPSNGFAKPIRVLDLMNHTAGLEETAQLEDATEDFQLRSLSEALKMRRPERVREPGKLFSYSNYGAQLAGAIVAEVSGMDFETYVEQHIFAPLGMKHSTFREPYGQGAPRGLPLPMPAELAAERASALTWQDGKWIAEPYHYLLPAAPAGGASSTASDMARYMIALLDPALLERAGLLSAASGALLQQESFRPAPGLRGIHHGFINAGLGRHSKSGYPNLSHGGNAFHFESFLSLVPELGLGTFVTTNSATGVTLSRNVQEQLLRRYFPPKPRAPRLPITPKALVQYVGEYRDLRRSYTKLEALFSIDRVLSIALGKNGCLSVPLPAGEQGCFVQIGRDLFEKVDGDARLGFLRDARGQISHAVGALNGERVGLLDSALWLRAWLLAGLVVALAVIVAAVRRMGQQSSQTAAQKWAGWCLILTAVSWLAFYVTGIAWQLLYGGDPFHHYPQPLLVNGLRILLAAVLLSLLGVLLLPLIFRGAGWKLFRRLRHTLVLLVWLGLTLALQRWNVIGFHYF
jgi:CubicO group peptidase (beta-lactamase class C family)